MNIVWILLATSLTVSIIWVTVAVLRAVSDELVLNEKRTHCRCCHAELDVQGGHCVALVGRGFCRKCAGEITKGVQ